MIKLRIVSSFPSTYSSTTSGQFHMQWVKGRTAPAVSAERMMVVLSGVVEGASTVALAEIGRTSDFFSSGDEEEEYAATGEPHTAERSLVIFSRGEAAIL